MSHLAVAKTYKLFIGGAFPRSESGRTYQALDAKGGFLANAALGSRKDVRDAVVAARKGFGAWSKATPYNRGQVIYRIAEMLEGRSAQFVELIMISGGASKTEATAEVEAAIDRLVHYAGWTDKLAAVFGGANPVSGPYFSYSAPEPTGVVGILAPGGSPLLGLVSVIAPVITSGNSCVVIAAEADPCVAVAFAEVVATSDLPGGVINIVTGRVVRARAAPGRARRRQRAGSHRCRCRAPAQPRAGGERDREAGLHAEGRSRLRRARRGRPGCGPSWRSRPSGIPSARSHCPAARRTEALAKAVTGDRAAVRRCCRDCAASRRRRASGRASSRSRC